jgi:hypothetical protein
VGDAIVEVQNSREVEDLSEDYLTFLGDPALRSDETRLEDKKSEVRSKYRALYRATLAKRFSENSQLAEELARLLSR